MQKIASGTLFGTGLPATRRSLREGLSKEPPRFWQALASSSFVAEVKLQTQVSSSFDFSA